MTMSFSKFITRSSITMLVLGIGILVGGFIVWQIGPVVAAFVYLPKFAINIANEGGINYWLALPIAIIFITVAFVGIKSIFRTGTRNKMTKFVLLIFSLIIIYSLAIFSLQQYKTQIKAVAMAETAAKLDDNLTTFKWLKVDRNTIFFDRVTKRPSAYYFKHSNGQLDIFSSPGVHPQIGVELKPMDSATAIYVADLFNRGLADKMINNEKVFVPSIAEAPTKKQIPVAAKKKASVQRPEEVARESSLQALKRQSIEQYEKLAHLLAPASQESSKEGGN
jgi:hypothetical protein